MVAIIQCILLASPCYAFEACDCGVVQTLWVSANEIVRFTRAVNAQNINRKASRSLAQALFGAVSVLFFSTATSFSCGGEEAEGGVF